MKSWQLLLGIVLLACCGCTHFSNIKKLDNVGRNEAVAIGTLRIVYEGKEDFKTTGFRTQNRDRTTIHVLSGSRFIAARLPVGENAITYVQIDRGFWMRDLHFEPGNIAFTLNEPGQVYYIGDITIDCTPGKSSLNPTRVAGAVLAGGPFLIADAWINPMTDQKMSLRIENNLEQTQQEFRKHFNTERALTQSLTRLQSTNLTTISGKRR